MKRYNLLATGLTLLAFLLRAYRLEAQSYWIDEAWTLFYANQSLAELWQSLQTIRAAPPLYHILTIYWIQLVGDGEYALRFLSLLFSVAAVPLTYRLGKLFDIRLGLLAALLMAVAPYQIWHAQDARNYSMLTAAATLSMWSFFNLWHRGGWRWRLLYVLSTEWAVLTHYHGLIIIGIQGLFFLLAWRRYWRRYLAWAVILAVILGPLAAWLVFGSRLWQSDHWLPQVGLWDSFVRNTIAYSVGELVPRPLAIWLTAAFVVLYGLGLIYAGRRRWRIWSGPEMLAFLVAYTLAPNLAVWLYSQFGTSVYLERYLIPVQVGYLLAVAAGILAVAEGAARVVPRRASLSRGLSGAASLLATVLLLGISGWVLAQHYNNSAYAKESWRSVIRTIEAFSLPGDGILLTGDGGEKLFDYYYQGDLPVYDSFNTPVPPPDEARRLLAKLAAGHSRLWYTPYGVDIDVVLESWLAENSYPAWQSWLGRKRLALYDTQPELQRQELLEAIFSAPDGQKISLLRADLPQQSTAAGDLLSLKLTWQTDALLPADYRLSLRLTNQRGDLFAQSDWPPLGGPQSTSAWPPNRPVADRRSLWVPADIPPGSYLLQLVIYDPASGQALGPPAVIPDIAIGPAAIRPPLKALAIPNLSEPEGTEKRPLSLVGYALPAEIQPGQEMWLWLYWQNQAAPAPELTLRLSLAAEDQSFTTDYLLSESIGPLDSWQPGQVRRAIYHLPTSPRLAGDAAEVRASLISGEGAEAEIPISEVKLAVRPRRFEQPAISRPVEAAFGNPTRLKLLGYDLPEPGFAPGDDAPVTLYWQAEAEMDTNYTVFIQLLNGGGQVAAQVDLPPQAGAAPTTTWLPGEILVDPYTLSLPLALPAGEYRLIAGLYDPATGQRLPVATGGDFVELGQIRVK